MSDATQLLQLNGADYLILAIISISMVISFLRGLIKECVSLGIWIVGFWVAIKFHQHIAEVLAPFINNASLRIIASFGVIFVMMLLLGAMVNFSLSFLISKSGLSGFDRIFGMIFGGVRGVLLITIFLLLISTTSMVHDDWWQHSAFIPYFHTVIEWLKDLLPDKLLKLIPSV